MFLQLTRQRVRLERKAWHIFVRALQLPGNVLKPEDRPAFLGQGGQ